MTPLVQYAGNVHIAICAQKLRKLSRTPPPPQRLRVSCIYPDNMLGIPSSEESVNFPN